MILLQFRQKEKTIHFGGFEDITIAREFLSKIPGYYLKQETYEDTTYIYDFIDYSKLPLYLEIPFKNNVAIISQTMFDVDIIEIDFIPVYDFISLKNNTNELCTIVDAYSIPNEEVKQYIHLREQKYEQVKNILEKQGYLVERNFKGSEDGEAIVAYNNKNQFHFITHLDPCFVEENVETLVNTFLSENLHEK